MNELKNHPSDSLIKFLYLIANEFQILNILVLDKIKRRVPLFLRGPRVDPWGTPQLTSFHVCVSQQCTTRRGGFRTAWLRCTTQSGSARRRWTRWWRWDAASGTGPSFYFFFVVFVTLCVPRCSVFLVFRLSGCNLLSFSHLLAFPEGDDREGDGQ